MSDSVSCVIDSLSQNSNTCPPCCMKHALYSQLSTRFLFKQLTEYALIHIIALILSGNLLSATTKTTNIEVRVNNTNIII